MSNSKISKKAAWKWWWQSNNNNNSNNNNKDDDNCDCASSLAPSSLMVHRSIHSKESDDILSTASIKSKPWISQKSTISPTQEDINKPTTPSSSFMLNVPSITSSTVPVINFEQEQRKKNSDVELFSGIKVSFFFYIISSCVA